MQPHDTPYNDYGSAMRRRLGGRVQKLAIDAAMGCPNRDGGVARGGCTFCLNEAFSPDYCRTTQSITEQIDRGIAFHAARRRYATNYIAYFQSGSNTYAPVKQLERLYQEALQHPKIGGLIVGTRPDCISSEILNLLEHLSKSHYIAIEYGIESTSDNTLKHVNRGHTYADAVRAVELTKARNIEVGAHFILGLPGESRTHLIEQTELINALKPDFIKFHQLQIYRSTPMAKEWSLHPERFLFDESYTVDDYIELIIDILRRLDPEIAIERIASTAPRHLLLHSPLRGTRMDELRNRLINKMHIVGARQGDLLFR